MSKTGAAQAVKKTTRKAAKRAGVKEPWRGYSNQTVDEIKTRLEKGDETLAKSVRRFERAHKDRVGVLEAADREVSKT